jgi:hypothetical protein
MTNYQAQMNQANELYNQLLNERNVLRSIYGKMYDDEYNHRMQELQIWADNLQAETSRYAEDQANYRAQLAKQLNPYEQYMLDKEKAADAQKSQASDMFNAIMDNGRYVSPTGRAYELAPQIDTNTGMRTYAAPAYLTNGQARRIQ